MIAASSPIARASRRSTRSNRSWENLSDDELRARTVQFRDQIANGAKLDDLLVPAFATVREAARRVLGERHFDVQLIGGAWCCMKAVSPR